MTNQTSPKYSQVQDRLQQERLLERLNELAKKYDISHQISATGDILGALSQVLAQAKAELDAIQIPIVGTLTATEAPDVLVATATVGRTQAITGTGSLTMSGGSVSVEARVTHPKNLSDLSANLPEVHRRFLDLLVAIAAGLIVEKLATQGPITVNFTQNTTNIVTQSAPAPRYKIMMRINNPSVALLRDAPTLDSDVIASMRGGDLVFWEHDQMEWTKVVYYETGGNQYTGWVLSTDLAEYEPTEIDE